MTRRAAPGDAGVVMAPVARMKALAALRGNQLYIYGGIVEPEEASELTLSDLWCVDVAKLDGWACLHEGEAPESSLVKEEDSDDDDDDSDDDEEDDSESSSSSDDEAEAPKKERPKEKLSIGAVYLS